VVPFDKPRSFPLDIPIQSGPREEALTGGSKFHYGDLNLSSLQSAEGLNLPETVNGHLYLVNLKSAEGLNLQEILKGNLYLGSLKSAEASISRKP
jgi:hypothetical protein